MPDNLVFLKYLPESFRNKAEVTTFLALTGCVSLVLVSIAASQILLAAVVAGSVWMLKKYDDYILPRMQILLPLIIFMVWTLIAAFVSANVSEGLTISKKFYLFLLVPLVPLLVRGRNRLNWIYKAILLVAAISSLIGLVQFAVNPDRNELNRISGSMSQWMTYSGLLMLALVLLTAYGFAAGFRKHKWVIAVALVVVLALVLSWTRNAWIGAVAGITVLVILWRPRAIAILLAAILALYVLSPGVIKHRLQSAMDMKDPRLHVYLTAMHLIQDNPWFGVGPKNVKHEAPKYREEKDFPDWLKRIVAAYSNPSQYREEEKEFPAWLYQHMHNNLFQIAAETGIPGLIIWLWFMGRLAWDALSCYRSARKGLFAKDEGLRKEALMASSAALACWAALMLAGMFEYNFGDSEVLTLFLFTMSAPYAFLGAPGVSPAAAETKSLE
jgi:putative inorganic carbon (hco3(-)) transporter